MWRGRPRPRLWECITVLKECLANRKRLRRPNLFHGPINYGLQFPRVLHLTPFGVNCLLHFQQKGFYDEFLHTWVAPENSFGVNIQMEVPRLDMPANSSLFQ